MIFLHIFFDMTRLNTSENFLKEKISEPNMFLARLIDVLPFNSTINVYNKIN